MPEGMMGKREADPSRTAVEPGWFLLATRGESCKSCRWGKEADKGCRGRKEARSKNCKAKGVVLRAFL